MHSRMYLAMVWQGRPARRNHPVRSNLQHFLPYKGKKVFYDRKDG